MWILSSLQFYLCYQEGKLESSSLDNIDITKNINYNTHSILIVISFYQYSIPTNWCLCWRIYLTKHTTCLTRVPILHQLYAHVLSVKLHVPCPYYIVIGHVLSYHTWPGKLVEHGKCFICRKYHHHTPPTPRHLIPAQTRNNSFCLSLTNHFLRISCLQ